jgi:hypothetical protein
LNESDIEQKRIDHAFGAKQYLPSHDAKKIAGPKGDEQQN